MFDKSSGLRVGRNLVLSCNGIGNAGVLELQRAMKVSANSHTLGIEGMRVPMGRRAKIRQDSAPLPVVEMTATCTLPRLRLESIHYHKKEEDLEAKVAREFKTQRKLVLSKKKPSSQF